MKLRRLPEIDLAEVTSRPEDEQYRRLYGFEGGGGGWSYDPARNAIPDVFQAQGALDLRVDSTPIAATLREVERACKKGKVQIDSNLEVTQLLYEWASANAVRAEMREIPSLSIGAPGLVRFWSNVLAEISASPTIMYFDHRRRNGLTERGRRVAFSAMHEHVRIADPDLASVELMIMQFPKDGNGRRIQPHFCKDMDLYSYEELVAMFQRTYDIWRQVLADKARDPESEKKAAAGGTLL